MALRGPTELEIEQLRRIDDTWSVSPLVLAAVSRLVELHDDAGGLRSLLQEGLAPAELAERLQQTKRERGELFLTEVLRLTIEWLFLEHNREPCKVCGNTPGITGTIKHGRECYVVSEDGGGESVSVSDRKTP